MRAAFWIMAGLAILGALAFIARAKPVTKKATITQHQADAAVRKVRAHAPIYVSQSLYDQMKRGGYDMREVVAAQRLPLK